MREEFNGNLERKFSFKEYWGPEYLKPYLTFSRKGKHFCIYCGEESGTREHVPSKVFLDEPYPEDLPVLPACFNCNNGFSDDEAYVETYIDCMKMLSGYSQNLSEKNQKRIYKNTAFIDAQKDLADYYQSKEICVNRKILRIITKLAVGHLVYELSEGYSKDGCCINPSSVDYRFLFELSEKERQSFDSFIVMDEKVLPSLGSRVFDKIFALEPVLNSINGDSTLKVPICIMNWTDIQEGSYKYIAWYENNGVFHVRIVIKDFLYAEIEFMQE